MIFDSTAVVLAVSELTEITLAVTNHGLKAVVTTMAETVAGIRTAAMTVNTVTVAAEM